MTAATSGGKTTKTLFACRGYRISRPDRRHSPACSKSAMALAWRAWRRPGRYGAELVGRIHGPELGRLGEAQRSRLGVVDVAAPVDPALDGGGVDLAAGAGDRQQLRTVREELGGAALVGLDVRRLVAQD